MSASPVAATVAARPPLWQENRFVPLAATLISLAAAACYSNSFAGPFVFDDHPFIETNPYIRSLWPPGRALFGVNNVSRPLVGYSLAVNYWLSGLSPWSYHALNLLIHIVAALALFGLVRRTLQSPRLAGRYAQKAGPLALAVALIWAVHPLQTQAVTYVIQRCESLMGMCYLLTVYCAVRSFTAEKSARWMIAAGTACVAGMLSKQVMVTAPFAVLLFDYLFFSSSLMAALRRHWRLYAGLAAGWLALLATIIAAPVNDTAGFGVKSITPLQYLISEISVICHYVRLALVPTSLAFDYEWAKAPSLAAALPYAIPVGLCAALFLFGLYRRAPWAIFGAWFFLILSVTSTVMPFDDLAFEYRMYLPLAAIIAGVVIGGVELWRRVLVPRLIASGKAMSLNGGSLAFLLIAALVIVYGGQTFARNQDYQSEMALWADTVVKRPENARARNNFGYQLQRQGRLREAIAQYTEAIALNPSYSQALYNRGTACKELGEVDQAERDLDEAVRLNPSSADAENNLGSVLASRGDMEAGAAHFRRALELKPAFIDARLNLATALLAGGHFAEARGEAEAVLQRAANVSEAHFILAVADESLNEYQVAEQHLREAIRLDANNAGARLRLCQLLRRLRRDDEAAALCRGR
ncbi:MAG TPA: tetratricopeptide repeat protein [Blastocatellia bacterium]|nr:tetratricopeptide repeat protein [Blastocatellia bacterium]